MLNFLNNSMKSRVKIIKEVPKNIFHKDWKLCFQWCQYIYENGTSGRSAHGIIICLRITPLRDRQPLRAVLS